MPIVAAKIGSAILVTLSGELYHGGGEGGKEGERDSMLTWILDMWVLLTWFFFWLFVVSIVLSVWDCLYSHFCRK